jgi:hypothetical protein
VKEGWNLIALIAFVFFEKTLFLLHYDSVS